MFTVTIPTLYQMLVESQNNWIMIKLILVLREFCGVEPRLKVKLKPRLQLLLTDQKAQSVQLEVIKTILILFAGEEGEELVKTAIKVLDQEYLSSQDPNLKYLGLSIVQDHFPEELVRVHLGKKLLIFVKEEQDTQIQECLFKIMLKLVSLQNYEWVIKCLFHQFRSTQNLKAIRAIIELHQTFVS